MYESKRFNCPNYNYATESFGWRSICRPTMDAHSECHTVNGLEKGCIGATSREAVEHQALALISRTNKDKTDISKSIAFKLENSKSADEVIASLKTFEISLLPIGNEERILESCVCERRLIEALLFEKSKLDHVFSQGLGRIWQTARSLHSPSSMRGSASHPTRSGDKLEQISKWIKTADGHEDCSLPEFLLKGSPGHPNCFVDICAGPGTWSKWLLDSCNKQNGECGVLTAAKYAANIGGRDAMDPGVAHYDKNGLGQKNQRGKRTSQHERASIPQKVYGYGISLCKKELEILKEVNCFAIQKRLFTHLPNFYAIYSSDKKGNIYNPKVAEEMFANLRQKFQRQYIASTSEPLDINKGVAKLVVADGGISIPKLKTNSGLNFESLQDVLFGRQLLSCLVFAFQLLQDKGTLVCALFDTFSTFTVSLLFLCTYIFEQVYVVKTPKMRGGNSERHLVGVGFKRFVHMRKQFTDISSKPDKVHYLNIVRWPDISPAASVCEACTPSTVAQESEHYKPVGGEQKLSNVDNFTLFCKQSSHEISDHHLLDGPSAIGQAISECKEEAPTADTTPVNEQHIGEISGTWTETANMSPSNLYNEAVYRLSEVKPCCQSGSQVAVDSEKGKLTMEKDRSKQATWQQTVDGIPTKGNRQSKQEDATDICKQPPSSYACDCKKEDCFYAINLEIPQEATAANFGNGVCTAGMPISAELKSACKIPLDLLAAGSVYRHLSSSHSDTTKSENSSVVVNPVLMAALEKMREAHISINEASGDSNYWDVLPASIGCPELLKSDKKFIETTTAMTEGLCINQTRVLAEIFEIFQILKRDKRAIAAARGKEASMELRRYSGANMSFNSRRLHKYTQPSTNAECVP